METQSATTFFVVVFRICWGGAKETLLSKPDLLTFWFPRYVPCFMLGKVNLLLLGPLGREKSSHILHPSPRKSESTCSTVSSLSDVSYVAVGRNPKRAMRAAT